MSAQRGFVPVLIVILIAVAALAGGFWIYQSNPSNPPSPSPSPVACTQDAKVCPDGSSVGRVSPKCAFAPCPTPESTSSADISNWKTYKSEKYGYSLKYPLDWKLEENVNYIGPGHPNYTFIFKRKVEIMPGVSIYVVPLTKPEDWSPIGGMETLNRYGTLKSIVVAGVQGTEVSNIPGAFVQKWVFINKNENTIIFHVSGDREEIDVFDQILSTFKFLP